MNWKRTLKYLTIFYILLCIVCWIVGQLAYIFKPKINITVPEGIRAISLYDSPDRLTLVMTGLEDRFILESPAGYIFVTKYFWACEKGKELMGDKYTCEVYASSYWASQLVRDLEKPIFY